MCITSLWATLHFAQQQIWFLVSYKYICAEQEIAVDLGLLTSMVQIQGWQVGRSPGKGQHIVAPGNFREQFRPLFLAWRGSVVQALSYGLSQEHKEYSGFENKSTVSP